MIASVTVGSRNAELVITQFLPLFKSSTYRRSTLQAAIVSVYGSSKRGVAPITSSSFHLSDRSQEALFRLIGGVAPHETFRMLERIFFKLISRTRLEVMGDT